MILIAHRTQENENLPQTVSQKVESMSSIHIKEKILIACKYNCQKGHSFHTFLKYNDD